MNAILFIFILTWFSFPYCIQCLVFIYFVGTMVFIHLFTQWLKKLN